MSLRVPSRTIFFSLVFAVVAGCGPGPSKANIQLRKTEQQLQEQIDQLRRQHDADQAQIAALQSHATTVPSLPADRLDQLFTAHGLSMGRLTGGYDADPNKPGDEMLKVYVVPTDDAGDPLKAAGSFTIDAFDLALPPGDVRLGHWEIDPATARTRWFGQALLYTYEFDLPWQKPPVHDKLLVRATFTDALTGRTFSTEKEVKVRPPSK